MRHTPPKSKIRAPTIKDVAAKAGVSTATVSHVLNDKGRAGAKTRDKVMAAVRALKLVDYVHVMSKGRVVYSATPAELQANEQIKASYLGI
mgnify:CR=1 FL=1